MELTLVTIKEYAKKKKVTYEAVRKQIQKYKDNELKDHIVHQGRTQYLDEYAVDFLDKRRKESPIMVRQTDRDDEIQRLQNENKALLVKVAELQDALIREKDVTAALRAEQIALLEQKQEKEGNDESRSPKNSWWERLFGGKS